MDPAGLWWGLRLLANRHMLRYLSHYGDLDIGEATDPGPSVNRFSEACSRVHR
jgi:hypothetical protein